MSQEQDEFLARYGDAKHIAELKDHPDWVVRSYITENPLTSKNVLKEYRYDKNLIVREKAHKRLE